MNIKKIVVFIILFVLICFNANAQWQPANGFRLGKVFCSLEQAQNIYIGTELEGVLMSTDQGLNWSTMNSGLQDSPVLAIERIGSRIYVGTKNYGVYFSNNGGLSWASMNSGLTDTTINTMLVKDSVIFIGTLSKGVFFSKYDEMSWTPINSGLTDTCIYSLIVDDSVLYAGTDNGVYKSNDLGINWISVNSGMPNIKVLSLTLMDSIIIAGTLDNYMYRSNNQGQTWMRVDAGLNDSTINALTNCGNRIFAGTNRGLYVSENAGFYWLRISSDWTANEKIRSLYISNQNVYAGTEYSSLYFSQDSGYNWNSMITFLSAATPAINAMASKDNILFAGSDGEGVFKSVNGGESWGTANIGLGSGFENRTINALLIDGAQIYAGTRNGVYKSSNNADSWLLVNNNMDNLWVSSLVKCGLNIYAGTGGSGIYVSYDDGAHWNPVNNGLSNLNVTSLANIDDKIFIGTYGGGIFSSDDYGVNWHEMNAGITNPYVLSLATLGTKLFAGTEGSGVFSSNNFGLNWINESVGLALLDTTVLSMINYGSVLFLGVMMEQVYCSTNFGTTWVNVSESFLHPGPVFSLSICDGSLFAGSFINVYKRPLIEMIGVSEIYKVDPFSVYPNPAQNVINIDLKNVSASKNFFVCIYDVHGKKVYQARESKKSFVIDIGNLINGAYFINIIDNEQVMRGAFIKYDE